MARPRIRQFADDLGISYDEAKGLVEEGRRRKDGGSQILENNMRDVKGFRDGGTRAGKNYKRALEVYKIMEDDTKIGEPMELPQRKPTRAERNMQGDADTVMMEKRREYLEREKKLRKNFRKGRAKERKAKDGTYMSCRGMGGAIQGSKFTGVK